MTQQRYYTRHFDSISGQLDGSPQSERHVINLADSNQDPPARSAPHALNPGRAHISRRDYAAHASSPVAEPGQQSGDVSTLRFLASRKLRRFDVEGPSSMSLSLNGQHLRVLQPGQNTFEPPIPLSAGDILLLEVLAEQDGLGDSDLTGWSTAEDTHQSGDGR